MANNDAADEISIYMDMDADECPAGLDPVLWYRYNYTCGLRNTALAGMILVSLLFVPVAAVLLCRLPGPASSASAPAPAPAADEAGGDQLPTLRQSVSVVWTVSLLVCSYLSFWIYTLSRTMGAAAVFLRVSYGAALVYAAAGLIGPGSGIAAAHLSTAWAAGLLGYALAEHRARGVAGLLPPPPPPPPYGEGNQFLIVFELSMLMWWILYMWAVYMNFCFLHGALVSGGFVERLIIYYIGSIFPVSVLCGLLLAPWFFIYYFGLEMMAMAAFFGYILAVSARCKEILARDQPLLKDLELGDVVQESASASTIGENA